MIAQLHAKFAPPGNQGLGEVAAKLKRLAGARRS